MELGSPLGRGKVLAIFAILAACAAAPAVANAAITVPPGATEGDQYFEETPNGSGSASVNRSGGGGEGGPPVAASQELEALGPEGQAAADLAESNRPPQQQQGKANVAESDEPASSSTGGEGGMGILFPLLLVVTAVAAVAYGLRRRLTPA
jgi:hypothetical protein